MYDIGNIPKNDVTKHELKIVLVVNHSYLHLSIILLHDSMQMKSMPKALSGKSKKRKKKNLMSFLHPLWCP